MSVGNIFVTYFVIVITLVIESLRGDLYGIILVVPNDKYFQAKKN